MYTRRFPPEVTAHHINPVVRYLTSEINRQEARAERAARLMEMQIQRVRDALAEGQGTDERDSAFVRASQDMSSALASRTLVYEVLGEVLGSKEEFDSFMTRYPPQAEPEQKIREAV